VAKGKKKVTDWKRSVVIEEQGPGSVWGDNPEDLPGRSGIQANPRQIQEISLWRKIQ